MRWGYLVDFLVAQNSAGILSSLIEEALADFRRNGVASVTCYATDPTVRRRLFLHGFFPVPKRHPIHFNHLTQDDRHELRRFSSARRWYLTMGDGELEMSV
jgi:hypothetical protein